MARYFYGVCYTLMVFLIIADQYTKHWVLQRFDYAEQLLVTDYFSLILLFNRGAAFSFLSDAGGWQRWFLIVVSIIAGIVLIVLIYRKHTEFFFTLMLTLIAAGAIGNLIDRVQYGYVVDFLLFHWDTWYWPAFNLADSCISIGVAGIVIHEIYPKIGQPSRQNT